MEILDKEWEGWKYFANKIYMRIWVIKNLMLYLTLIL